MLDQLLEDGDVYALGFSHGTQTYRGNLFVVPNEDHLLAVLGERRYKLHFSYLIGVINKNSTERKIFGVNLAYF